MHYLYNGSFNDSYASDISEFIFVESIWMFLKF